MKHVIRNRLFAALLFALLLLVSCAQDPPDPSESGGMAAFSEPSVQDASRTAEDFSRYGEAAKEEEAAEVKDEEIKQAYLEKYPVDPAKCGAEDLSVRTFGVFGGCHAVFVDGPFAYRDVITTQTVNGLRFVYNTSQTMHIFRDGSLYTLPEAWDAGVISAAALRELYDAFPGKGNYAVK